MGFHVIKMLVYAVLELISRFYAKYPEYAEKTFLSVKACASLHSFLQRRY